MTFLFLEPQVFFLRWQSTYFLFVFFNSSDECFSNFRSESIVISKRRTVLLSQIVPCPVLTQLYSCLFTDIESLHLSLFLFMQLHKDIKHCKYLPTIVTRNNSLEIRAVKLRFLFIYEIMLKSIATACSEYTAKQKNIASYSTYRIAPDLIDFFGYN